MTDLSVQHGVLYGCSVAASATPGMVVLPASGAVLNGNISASLSTTSVTIAAADSTQDRYDLISSDSAGVVTATTGALGSLTAGTCIQPDNSDVKLAYIPVAAGVTAINTSDIQDCRVFVHQDFTPYRVSGLWYGPIGAGNTLAGWTDQDMWLAPFFTAKNFSVQAVGIRVANPAATSGSKARLGIYRDDGNGDLTLLIDAGQVAIDAGAATASIAITSTLTPGWWWTALAFQSLGATKPTMYTASLVGGQSPVGASSLTNASNGRYGCIRYASISGALPTSPTSPDYSGTVSPPAVFLQAT